FQAEDGIRDFHVTGVQTCALPILCPKEFDFLPGVPGNALAAVTERVQERAQRGELGVDHRIIALHEAYLRPGLSGDVVDFSLSQIRRAASRERVKIVSGGVA